MDTYKHSCPFCGQHIEYTDGYCGQQMACPICGKTVTFPAIPPGGKKKQALHLKGPEAPRVQKWSFDLNVILANLRAFEHWNMVLAGLIPFVIVIALLVGAVVLKKKSGNDPAVAVEPVIQADTNAWQKMTDLARADQAVQDKVAAVTSAHTTAVAAEKNLANMRAFYQGKPTGPTTFYTATQSAANAEKILAGARQSFENAYRNYQQLGGTVDYRKQLPQ